MRSYLAVAPVWVAGVFQGVLFGIFWTAYTGVQDHRFGVRLLIIGVVVGAVFGVGMGFVTRRQRRRTDEIIGPLSPAQRRSVFRAAASGRPPDDPSLLDAAVAVIDDWLDQFSRTRPAVMVVSALLAVSSFAFATTDPWWFVAAAGCVAMFVWTLRYPVVLGRRVAVLESARRHPNDVGLAGR